MVVWLFLKLPWVCLRFVIVVIPDHTHLLIGLHGVTWKALCSGMNILPIIWLSTTVAVTTFKHSKICKLTLVCIDISGVKMILLAPISVSI